MKLVLLTVVLSVVPAAAAAGWLDESVAESLHYRLSRRSISTSGPAGFWTHVQHCSSAAFFGSVFQQRALYCPGRVEQWRGLHLNLDSVHSMIDVGGSVKGDRGNQMLPAQDFVLVKRVQLDNGEYWSATFDMNEPTFDNFNAAFNKGFSVVLNAVQRRWPPLAAFTKALTGQYILSGISANLYLTPPNAQAFEYHFDWMEVFVIQLHGSKQWKVYENPPMLHPFPTLKFKPSPEQVGTEFRSLTLSEGDVLYMPAGVIHEASATDEASLHLTIGLEISPLSSLLGVSLLALNTTSNSPHVPTISRALYKQAILPDATQWRRALPIGDWAFGSGDIIYEHFTNALKEFLQPIATGELLLAEQELDVGQCEPALQRFLEDRPTKCSCDGQSILECSSSGCEQQHATVQQVASELLLQLQDRAVFDRSMQEIKTILQDEDDAAQAQNEKDLKHIANRLQAYLHSKENQHEL